MRKEFWVKLNGDGSRQIEAKAEVQPDFPSMRAHLIAAAWRN